MDFLGGFPKVGGKSVILTIVDRFFSKFAHFISLSHPYSTCSAAKAVYSGKNYSVWQELSCCSAPLFTHKLMDSLR
jgi:hypothetical protein